MDLLGGRQSQLKRWRADEERSENWEFKVGALADLLFAHSRVFHHIVHRSERFLEQVHVQLLKFSARHFDRKVPPLLNVFHLDCYLSRETQVLVRSKFDQFVMRQQ